MLGGKKLKNYSTMKIIYIEYLVHFCIAHDIWGPFY